MHGHAFDDGCGKTLSTTLQQKVSGSQPSGGPASRIRKDGQQRRRRILLGARQQD
jgi:hypothetical protein